MNAEYIFKITEYNLKIRCMLKTRLKMSIYESPTHGTLCGKWTVGINVTEWGILAPDYYAAQWLSAFIKEK